LCSKFWDEGLANAMKTLHNIEEFNITGPDTTSSDRYVRAYMSQLQNFTQTYDTHVNGGSLNWPLIEGDCKGYEFAIYWRFLFENYLEGKMADRTKIWALSLKLWDPNDQLGSLTVALDSLNGNFLNFRESWEEFAKSMAFIKDKFDYGAAYLPVAIYPGINRVTGTYTGTNSYTFDPSNAARSQWGLNYLHFTFTDTVDTARVIFDGYGDTHDSQTCESSLLEDWSVYAYLGQSVFNPVNVSLNANQIDTFYIAPEHDDTLKIVVVKAHEYNDCQCYKITIDEP
jgi:hypothetical protein